MLSTSLVPHPLSSYSYILGLSPGSSYFFSIQTVSQVDFIHFQSIKNTDMFLTPRFLTTILMSGLIYSTAYLTCSFGCLIGISHLTCPCGPYRGLLSIQQLKYHFFREAFPILLSPLYLSLYFLVIILFIACFPHQHISFMRAGLLSVFSTSLISRTMPSTQQMLYIYLLNEQICLLSNYERLQILPGLL